MKMDVFKAAQEVNIHLGYFSKKICHQELSKNIQSGHTVPIDTWSMRQLLWRVNKDL